MRFAAIAILATLVAVPALADERDDAVANVIACGSVRGDKARLRCFEAASPALSQAFPAAVTAAQARIEAARIAAKDEAKEEFGLSPEDARADDPFEEKAFGAEDLPRIATSDEDDDAGDVQSIEAAVSDIGKSVTGRIIVILDNGQVWRQIDGDKATPYIRKKVDGVKATVKRGALGSYWVRIEGTRTAFKARRVK
jgi:hypothetical protein